MQIKNEVKKGTKDMIISFQIFYEKYKEVCLKLENQFKINNQKDYEKEKDLTTSTIFKKNNSNYDFLSLTIAEYFPFIDKNSSFYKILIQR